MGAGKPCILREVAAMLQYPYKITALAQLDACLQDFRQRCPAEHTDILIQVFSASSERAFLQELIYKLN